MARYKSQIRASQINALSDKVRKGNYRRFISEIHIVKLRGLCSQTVKLEFPVTALIGPNGGGKTTILGACALLYESVKPRQFFPKNGALDASMAAWKVEYTIIDRDAKKSDPLRRTAAFRKAKWARSLVKRDVAIFGVARTVPASERKEFQRYATGSSNPAFSVQITPPVAEAVEKILGKDISGYWRFADTASDRISLLRGETEDHAKYSEFHFGAGESSVIRMAMQIEDLPENSLVLIEEIENGLHPLATMRLVEYLIDVADRKSIQVVFTTHSDDALQPLPPTAIWASIGGMVHQGKLDIASLRTIMGQVDAVLAVFCEDAFAAAWVGATLRNSPGLPMDAIEIHAMSGDSTAIVMNDFHNRNPVLVYRLGASGGMRVGARGAGRTLALGPGNADPGERAAAARG